MRDGLAREFPEAVRAAAWTRARVAGRVAVWSEPVLWATISGIGAGFLAASVVQAIVGLTGEVIQALRAPTPFPLFPAVTIAGSAAAAAVALGAGGLGALVLGVAYTLVGVALRVPSLIFACDRSGGTIPFPGPDQCTALGFVASLWPQFVGIGLGIVIARTGFITRGEGANSLLRVSGALAIAIFVVSEAWAIAVAQGGYAAQTAGALTSTLTIGAGLVAAAVAAGVMAAQLPRGVRNALIVAGLWLLPWLVRLPTTLSNLGSTIPTEFVGPTLVSLVVAPIAAAFLVLSAAVASRARFIPRDVA
jgi:hypothetical protein